MALQAAAKGALDPVGRVVGGGDLVAPIPIWIGGVGGESEWIMRGGRTSGERTARVSVANGDKGAMGAAGPTGW